MLLSPSTPDQSFLTHFDMIKFDTMNLKEYLDKLPAPLNHPATLASLLVVAIFGRWFFTYLKVRMEVLGLPTTHSWIEMFESGFRAKLPNIPFLAPTAALTLEHPFDKYQKAKTDLLAYTQVTTPYAVYATSNPSVAAAISNKTSTYLKPTQMFRYQAINIFGLQIVSTQTGPEHKRHKAVVRGCFGEDLMAMGWDSMVQAYQTMVKEEGLINGGQIKDTKVAMIKTTLVVFGQSLFGMMFPCNIPKTDGPILPFAEALEIVEMSMIPQLLLPMWFMTYSPFSYLRRCAKAQRSLVHHINQMIAARRAQITAQQAAADPGEKVSAQNDILGALVGGQMQVEQDEKASGKSGGGLSPSEMFGNVFIFIVAGHETTGHGLSFCLALLALYPQCQEDIYDEIKTVCGDEYPSYRDMSNLVLTLATLYESLRLRDEVMFIPKLTSKDTFLPYTTWDDKGHVTHHQRLIKAGSHVLLDSAACNINPFYWDNAKEFTPKRHVGDKGLNVKDGFTGFSMGQRVCIGKRFAEVESVAFLSHLVKDYTFKPVPIKSGETWDEMRARLWKGTEELNLMPSKFALKFERRA